GETAPDEAMSPQATDGITAARRAGLGVLVDLRLDLLSADATIVAAQPAWFQPLRDSDVLPDPRHGPAPVRHVSVRASAAAAAPLADWWAGILARWCAAGVTAFRCLWPQRLPAATWRR